MLNIKLPQEINNKSKWILKSEVTQKLWQADNLLKFCSPFFETKPVFKIEKSKIYPLEFFAIGTDTLVHKLFIIRNKKFSNFRISKNSKYNFKKIPKLKTSKYRILKTIIIRNSLKTFQYLKFLKFNLKKLEIFKIQKLKYRNFKNSKYKSFESFQRSKLSKRPSKFTTFNFQNSEMKI